MAQTERSRLIAQISAKLLVPGWKIGQVADFILEDRRRICQPLIKYKNNELPFTTSFDAMIEGAIDDTLKLAGLDSSQQEGL